MFIIECLCIALWISSMVVVTMMMTHGNIHRLYCEEARGGIEEREQQEEE